MALLWFKNKGKIKGNILELTGDNIEYFPIPCNNTLEENTTPFIEIVDKILAITKSSDYLENSAKKEEVKEYENQIDRMVYKLYGLTPEEIEIVENKSK